MDISVIVPIYGVEKYIERCLRSLFTQTKTDGVEFILVNDCTKDRSMEIAREVIAQFPALDVKILEHTVNRHVAATRQTGLDAATGDYTIQIDSDDWCEPTMLEELYAKAIESGADVVCCNYYRCVDGVESEMKLYEVEHSITGGITPSQLRMEGLWNKLIRRALYVDNSISLDMGVNFGEDGIFAIKMLYHSRLTLYIPRAYYHYVYNSASITNSYTKVYDYTQSVLKLEEFFEQMGELSRYADAILEKKASIKIVFFRRFGARFQREYRGLYGKEVDSYILKSNLIPLTSKIPYYLIINRCYFLGNMIFKLSDIYNSRNK